VALEITPLRPVPGPNTFARYEHELSAIEGIGLTDIEMDSALRPDRRRVVDRSGAGPGARGRT